VGGRRSVVDCRPQTPVHRWCAGCECDEHHLPAHPARIEDGAAGRLGWSTVIETKRTHPALWRGRGVMSGPRRMESLRPRFRRRRGNRWQPVPPAAARSSSSRPAGRRWKLLAGSHERRFLRLHLARWLVISCNEVPLVLGGSASTIYYDDQRSSGTSPVGLRPHAGRKDRAPLPSHRGDGPP
jgi:hypothetical protein